LILFLKYQSSFGWIDCLIFNLTLSPLAPIVIESKYPVIFDHRIWAH